MAVQIAVMRVHPFDPVREDGLCPSCYLPSLWRFDAEVTIGTSTVLSLVSVTRCGDCGYQAP